MTQYQKRKAAGVCAVCGGARETHHVTCRSCRKERYDHERRTKTPEREMWFASPTQRLYSFIVRGGKIQSKGAK